MWTQYPSNTHVYQKWRILCNRPELDSIFRKQLNIKRPDGNCLGVYEFRVPPIILQDVKIYVRAMPDPVRPESRIWSYSDSVTCHAEISEEMLDWRFFFVDGQACFMGFQLISFVFWMPKSQIYVYRKCLSYWCPSEEIELKWRKVVKYSSSNQVNSYSR